MLQGLIWHLFLEIWAKNKTFPRLNQPLLLLWGLLCSITKGEEVVWIPKPSSLSTSLIECTFHRTTVDENRLKRLILNQKCLIAQAYKPRQYLSLSYQLRSHCYDSGLISLSRQNMEETVMVKRRIFLPHFLP